jgi:hypothetical protein
MSRIPSLKKAKELAEAETKTTRTIICKNCKKHLWDVSEIKSYGTRHSAKTDAYPGVPKYEDVWKRVEGGFFVAHDLMLCPFCSEEYGTIIQSEKGVNVFTVQYL